MEGDGCPEDGNAGCVSCVDDTCGVETPCETDANEVDGDIPCSSLPSRLDILEGMM